MEAEIGLFLCQLYNGTDDSRGIWCPGGSFSNITAIYAAREHAYKENFIKQPELIMCQNGHPSLEKGGKITKMKVITIESGKDYRIDVAKVLSAINCNTAVVCLSAPSYPRGVIDDIETIAKVCYKRNIWVHVDGCIGSLITPFLKENNFKVFSKFDFTVEGVCSISCDTHKQGLGPKGASYLLYKTCKHFRQTTQYTLNWEGGILPSLSLEGSKPGAIIASTWAVMMHMGREGYKHNSFRIHEKVEYLAKEISKLHPLYIQGTCDAMIVAFGCRSNKYSIQHIRDRLKELGWYLKDLQQPPGMHIAITNNNINNIDELISELKMIISSLDRMSKDELAGMNSGPGIQAMTEGFANGIKMEVGIDNLLEIMSNVGMVKDEDENKPKLVMDLKGEEERGSYIDSKLK